MMRIAARNPRRQRQLRLVAVAGGRTGVGATTVAVNFAAELARQGQRTLLVDADLEGGDIAARLGLADESCHAVLGVAEVLTARRKVREVLRDGPFGLSIVPGVCRVEQGDAWTEAAQDRLVRALRDLDGEADVVVLDAGRGTTCAGHRLCDTADETLIVTTTEDEALMDAYATIKATHEHGHGKPIRVLFNRVHSEAEAHSARERLEHTCRRFLGTTLDCAGCCLEDRRVAQSSAAGVPLVVQSPRSPLVRDLERLAAKMSIERSQPAVPTPYGALINDRAALATA